MAALNFDQILLMLKDPSSIPWETLPSQDGLNFGDVCFCPLRQILCMQCLSLNPLQKLIAEGAFMPPQMEGPPELSGTTAILLVFQADSQHEEITDVYMGLIVYRVESHLYTPDQILDFIKDIEVDLQVVHDALKAGGGSWQEACLLPFVSNFGGTMSIPHRPALLPGLPDQLCEGCSTGPLQHPQQPVGEVLAPLPFAVPHYSSPMMTLNSLQNIPGAISSCLVGPSIMTNSFP